MIHPVANKRKRLVEAALTCFHQNGYSKTSLADIAKESKVPLGNVSYYFKAKADLAQAVIEEWQSRITSYLPLPETDPWLALRMFAEQVESLSEMYATTGCPLAGLARDLRQEAEPLQSQAAFVQEVQFAWIESQFGSSGYDRVRARKHASFFYTHLQGALHLAYTLKDEGVIADEVENLYLWLDDLKLKTTISSG